MAKITLTDVSAGTGLPTGAAANINSNNNALETAIENTLSRDGTSPNAMEADFDMNDNDILNAGTVFADTLNVDTVIIDGQELDLDGVTGPQGPPGNDGLGVPTGGSQFQLLMKNSATDNDTTWTSVLSGLTSLLLGTTTSYNFGMETGSTFVPVLQQHGQGVAGFGATRWAANSVGARVGLGKSRGAAVGTRAIVQNGDTLGSFSWSGDDGTEFRTAAYIAAAVDGVPNTSDMPGRLTFGTTPAGSITPVEHLRVSSAGQLKAFTNVADVGTYVATRTILKALATTKATSVYLSEAGREGWFSWKTGDYSTQIAADTAEGLYIKANAHASTVGAWVRDGDWATDGADARWFGVVADYDPTLQTGTDNTAALNVALVVADHVVLPKGNILLADRVSLISTAADDTKKLVGAGRRLTRIYINDGFNLATDAVIKLTGGTGDRHTLGGFSVICQDQPDDASLANYIEYPAVVHAQNMPRFEMFNMRIQEAYVGVDMTGNSGGAYIDDLEMSAFYRGILIDGSLDSVKITRLHWWPFGFPSVTNKKNVMALARGIECARCDDFHLENSILFSSVEAAYFYTSVNGSTFGSISSTDFDDRGGLVVLGGDLVVTGCIFTMGTAKDSEVIRLNSSTAKLTLTSSYIYIGGASLTNAPFNLLAGTFIMSGCIVFDVQNDNYTFRLASGGASANITGNSFLFTATTGYLFSLIIHTGPGTLLFTNNTLSAFSGAGTRSLVLTSATPGAGIIRNNLLGAGWTINVDAANYNYYVERHQERWTTLTADRTGTDVATAQNIFDTTADTLTVDAATTYEFETEVVITRAAGTTSHTTAFLLGGTATFTSIDYLAKVSNPTGNVLGTVSEIQGSAATAVVLTAANTSATENVRMRIRGIFRVNAGGTIIPQFQFSAAPGGAPTIKRNSFFRCRPIGGNTVIASGPWS